MSEKECDHCFEMVDDDVELCIGCEEEERMMDELDDMDEDDLDDLEDEEDDLETCAGCGNDFSPEEMNGDLCDECVEEEERGLDEGDTDE